MTALEAIIRELIVAEGPMRLDRFMGLALGHPRLGYYTTRDPFGAGGDFITAPEVSQVFGELIGVWCASAWAALGRPSPFNLIELGPGRGTLMADLLRAARVVPGFTEAARVRLVEISSRLRAAQSRAIGNGRWFDTIEEVPQGPTILIANEFFDAIPIRQFERRNGRWLERVVGLTENKLQLGLIEAVEYPEQGQVSQDGDIIEWSPQRDAIATAIGARLAAHPGVALIVDYGHASSAPGDTLQAVRAHQPVPVTEAPGGCDLTSHVDFEALGKALRAGGAATAPVITQRDFLLAMGLEPRFAALAAKADAATRDVLGRAKSRLADREQMGNLFKVLAAHTQGLATPYPFGRS